MSAQNNLASPIDLGTGAAAAAAAGGFISEEAEPSAALAAKPEAKPTVVAGFRRKGHRPAVTVILAFGFLPETLSNPIRFDMDLQLVREAEEANSDFIMLSDDEQKEQRFEQDVRMISLLTRERPSGLADFPEIPAGDREALQGAIVEYFMGPDLSADESAVLEFLARRIMGSYWQKVAPADYL